MLQLWWLSSAGKLAETSGDVMLGISGWCLGFRVLRWLRVLDYLSIRVDDDNSCGDCVPHADSVLSKRDMAWVRAHPHLRRG